MYLTHYEFRRTQLSNNEVALAQVHLLSKMTALLAAGDVMAFQGIQAMEPTYEATVELPTEEDLDALLDRHTAGETLTEEEYERIERATFGG